MTRKGPQLVGGLHQPLQHRVRVDLENARRPPDAQAFGQAPDDVHDALDGHAFTMQDRAMGLHITPCGRTFQSQPRYQGPARWAVEAYVPHLITSPSS